MKLIINQGFKNYKSDSIRYLIFHIFNKSFIFSILFYIVVVSLHILNKGKHTSVFPDIINLLASSLGIGVLGMIIYSAFHLIKLIKNINKEANTLYEGKLHIIMDDTYVTVQTDSNRNYYKKNWNQIKELIVINDTAYFIPVNKIDSMFKINKDEILEGDFEEVLELIKNKWKR